MSPTVADVTRALRDLATACGVDVPPAATDAELAGLVERVAALGAAVPPEHLDLLRDLDGVEANGLRVFGTTRRALSGNAVLPALDETALDLEGGELPDHLVLAQGSITFYAVHRRTGAFTELDVVPGQVLAHQPSYAALMDAAVRAQS